MTTKDELITGILNKELKSIKKLLKEQEAQLNDIRTNGFDKEIHKSNHENILTGLSYTIGYCTCKIEETKKILSLMKLDVGGITKLIEKNKEIEKLNKKEMDKIFREITRRVEETSAKNKIKAKK